MTQANSIDASTERRPSGRLPVRAFWTALSAAALSAVAVSALAATPQRFDLTCTGAVTRTIHDDSTSAAWSGTMRVDLVRDRICLDDCLDARTVVVERAALIESLSVG